MGVVHGPGHMEVKYTTTGPCLVEVGTRCHGGEGTWQAIAQECLGYNQVGCSGIVLGCVLFVRQSDLGSWGAFCCGGIGSVLFAHDYFAV